MKIEFIFNGSSTLRLTPENAKEKHLIALYLDGGIGVKIIAGNRDSPESLVIERTSEPEPV